MLVMMPDCAADRYCWCCWQVHVVSASSLLPSLQRGTTAACRRDHKPTTASQQPQELNSTHSRLFMTHIHMSRCRWQHMLVEILGDLEIQIGRLRNGCNLFPHAAVIHDVFVGQATSGSTVHVVWKKTDLNRAAYLHLLQPMPSHCCCHHQVQQKARASLLMRHPLLLLHQYV